MDNKEEASIYVDKDKVYISTNNKICYSGVALKLDSIKIIDILKLLFYKIIRNR